MWKNPYLEEALNIGGQANKEATTLGKVTKSWLLFHSINREVQTWLVFKSRQHNRKERVQTRHSSIVFALYFRTAPIHHQSFICNLCKFGIQI